MNTNVTIMRLIPANRSEVFRYFTDPQLIEMWSAPTGMTLKVPFFEAKIGGQYRYEHTAKDGVYVCTGAFSDFQPGTKLSMVDKIAAPDGHVLFPRLESIITFSDKPGGTFVTVTQKGFADEKSAQDCEQSWNQCFDQLASLVSGRDALSA